MSNEFYNGSGVPAFGSIASSASMRTEFLAIASGFNKLPTISGNAGKLLRINAAETGLESFSLSSGALIYTNSSGAASASSITQSATGNITIPAASSGTTLSVQGDAAAVGTVTVTGTTAIQPNITVRAGSGASAGFNRARLNLLNQAGTAGWSIYEFGDGSDVFAITTYGGSDRLTIAQAGNVTINAPSSGNPLAVITAANSIATDWWDGTTTLRASFSAGNANFGTVGSQSLSLLTSNSARVVISSAGNVTVSAPSSGTALSVAAVTGAISTPVAAFAQATNGTNFTINSPSAPGFYLNSALAGDSALRAEANNLAIGAVSGSTSIATATRTIATFASSGNVTINAPSSGTTLALSNVAGSSALTMSDGTVSGMLRSQTTTSIDFGTTSAHALNLYTNFSARLLISSAGNVTINSPSSGSALTVNGLISGVTNPVSAQDVATKSYVDSTATGLTVKTAARVATTANITLSGTQTIDGVSVVAGDRVLVKNQTTTSQNGVYDVAVGAWTRSTDSDTAAEVTKGAFIFVSSGSTQGGTGWTETATVTTLGTDPVVYSQFSGGASYAAGTGLTLTGTTFSITNTTVTAASYGSASSVATFTVNAQGQLSAASSTSISIAGSQITSGTVGDSFLSSNIPLKNAANTFTGGLQTSNSAAGTNLSFRATSPSGAGNWAGYSFFASGAREYGIFAFTTDGGLYFQDLSAAATRMIISSSGNVQINAPTSGVALNISGYTVSGNALSTAGSKILGGNYSNGNIATFGGEYSNGGPVIGYGVWPSTTAAGSFVSSTGITVGRGAYTVLGADHIWYGGASQTVAIDSAVTLSERMRLNSAGSLTVNATAANYAGILNAASGSWTGLAFQENGTSKWVIFEGNAGTGVLSFGNTNTSTALTVNQAGNWVFAAPTSGSALTVGGAAASGVTATIGAVATGDPYFSARSTGTNVEYLAGTVGGSNGVFSGSFTNHAYQLRTNNSDRITISNVGNVTINSPGSGVALTVTGDMNVGTASYASWGTTIGGIIQGYGYALSTPFNGGFDTLALTSNAYNSGTSVWNYRATAAAGQYQVFSGVHKFNVAVSGTAGAAVTWNTAMQIANAGNVTINAPSSGISLNVTGLTAAGTNVYPIQSYANTSAFTIFPFGNSNASGSTVLQVGGANDSVITDLASLTNAGWVGTNTNHPFSIYSNNTARIAVAAAGNVTINAPTSGIPLTISGLGASNTNIINFNGNTTGSQYIQWNSSGNTTNLGIDNSSGGYLVTGSPAYATVLANNLARDLVLGTNNAVRVLIGSAGNVTINAPSSGNTLTANMVSGGSGLVVTGAGGAGATISTSQPSGTTNYWRLGQPGVINWDLQNVATTGVFSITNGSQTPFQSSGAGNVTIGAPSSGIALAVTGFSTATALEITQGATAKGLRISNGSGSMYLQASGGSSFVGTDGAWGLDLGISSTAKISISTFGNAQFANAAATTSNNAGSTGGAVALECRQSNVHTFTLTSNMSSLTLNNPSDGQTINLFITQDATGNRTATWPASFKWPSGSSTTLSTAANAVDLLTITYRAATGFWYASLLKGFA